MSPHKCELSKCFFFIKYPAWEHFTGATKSTIIEWTYNKTLLISIGLIHSFHQYSEMLQVGLGIDLRWKDDGLAYIKP